MSSPVRCGLCVRSNEEGVASVSGAVKKVWLCVRSSKGGVASVSGPMKEVWPMSKSQ